MPSLKLTIAMSVAVLTGVACSSPPASSPKPAAGIVQTTVTTTPEAPKQSAFDPQAYCVEKLTGLAAKYPKSLSGSDLAAECHKMLTQTDATSAKTIDALLATAETYYKAIG